MDPLVSYESPRAVSRTQQTGWCRLLQRIGDTTAYNHTFYHTQVMYELRDQQTAPRQLPIGISYSLSQYYAFDY